MAYLDPKQAFADLKTNVLEGLQTHFPITGTKQSIHLEGLNVREQVHDPGDLEAQHKTKIEGRSWGVPVFGTLALKNNETGAVIDRKTVKLADLPQMTQRHSYIVDGQEYQVDNQWRLKHGVYTRRRDNGELETQFNTAGKKNFDITFNPEKKVFSMTRGSSENIPIYPMLKHLGVDDDTLEKSWGKDILSANRNARGANTSIERFYKADKKKAPASAEEARQHFLDSMSGAQVRPDSTLVTLGKAYTNVNGDMLHAVTTKMIGVQRGDIPEDQRDSLVFKDLRTVADVAKDQLTNFNTVQAMRRRVNRKINTATSIREVIRGDMLSTPVKAAFTDNSLSRVADQVNPVEMITSSFQTTIMGPGGIQSDHQVSDAAKLISPSHLGFIDPLMTPEGCYDGHTEVFTDRGWVQWPYVTNTHKFACLIDGRLEFHHAQEIQVYAYNGKMYGLRRQLLEYLVTPNHRMLCRPLDAGSAYRVVRADEMHGRVRAFKSGHEPLLGVNASRYTLPFVPGNNSSKNITDVDFGDFAEFIGWYLSEGHCCYVEEKSAYRVKLFQSEVNGVCCRQIEALLDRLPFAWSMEERDHGRNVYVVATKQIAGCMHLLGDTSDEKRMLEEMFTWPLHARMRLLNALMLGDGRLGHTHKKPKQHSYVYTTTSTQLAYDVERLIISLGWGAAVKKYLDKRKDSYRDVYEVRLLMCKEVTTQARSKGQGYSPYYTIEYNGYVYCASVPGTFLYIRRGVGHPLWLGNSKTGVTSCLPLAVTKEGNNPMMPVFNLKTQKMERIDPVTFHNSRTVLPDQVTWNKGKPTPVSDRITISQKGNDLVDGDLKSADYVMRNPSQLFSLTANLMPFLGNNSGNRASYAAHHIEQAISLHHRDAPLVQVGTGRQDAIKTFEDFVGKQSAHTSPIEGTVKTVTDNHIIVEGADGVEKKVGIYNNFPLNDPKAVLHSTPAVQPGDKVTSGQLLADNNFTRNGTLALGKNLRVAFIPMKGYNFEDGVVISQTGADKMASEHMHKPTTVLGPDMITGLYKFKALHPTSYEKNQLAKLSDDGIVQVGQVVHPGDPLVVASRPYESKGSLSLSRIRKSLSAQNMDASLSWKNDHAGEVVGVHRDDKGNVVVHVKTIEPMQVGDKIAGRHGNKGIVTAVVPDHEMPHTINEHGEKVPIELALNPSGVPGRMNMGQILETAASKIALKTGKPYIVNNFEYGVDALDRVKKELKANGLSDTEVLHDPMSGQELGPALVGHQHILKLNFQIDKKVSVRSGMPLEGAEAEYHDADTLIPSSGGKTGGQSMGNLGMYSLLAHSALANIREMQTWKSEGDDRKERWNSLHHEVWNAIQNGDIPPPPKKTFAFQKFEDMLKASGIDVQKKGHQMLLTPLTGQQVLKMSAGELPEPAHNVYAKPDINGEPATRKGGLFDPALTGGHGGKNWTHITLPEPVPNPVFESAIQRVTGLTKKQYTDVVEGEKAIHKETGKVVDLGSENSIAGGAGIAHLLGQMDVKKELAKSQKQLDAMNIPANIAHRDGTQKVDQLSKKVRYLTALDNAGIHPKDAYVLEHLPVIPPIMRPATFLPSGDVNNGDLNQLYSAVGDLSTAMKSPNYKYLHDSDKKEDRASMYDGVKALMGVGENWGERGKQPKGLLLQIAGDSPKKGYFQKTLLSRRQDMTMRATITPEPGLGLDSVGLPEKKALDLFRPFVVNKLVEMGAANTPREAHALLAEPDKKDPMVYKALDHVMAERPVLLKRDPSLHKHSVQAFWSQRVPGKAIQIHPLVTSGFSADFDGDQMSVYVPIGKDAVEEAKRMVPSANIYNEASGKVMYQPTLEASLGLFKLSRVTGDGKDKFDTHADLLKAVQDGKVKMTDKAEVNGKLTTAGRVMLASAMPEALHQDVLYNLDSRLNKKGVDKLYTTIAKDHTHDFADCASKLMRLGYDTSFGAIKIQNPNTMGTAGAVQKEGENPKEHVQFLPVGTHSLSLEDFTPDKATRDPIVAVAQKKVDGINARTDISDKEKEHHVIETWFDATEKMVKEHDAKMDAHPNNLHIMQQAGVKPSPDQYRQLRLAPMLMVDSLNKVIAKPVTKSYAEGLDIGSYWSQMSGARRGSVLKVQEVREPGTFTKELMNSMMGLQVTDHDCGTAQGLHMPVHSQDIFDRTLAQDHTIGGVTYTKNTIVTPQIASAIKATDKNATLLVRSTLKCENGSGVCQQCAGLAPSGQHYSLGSNVGVMATQALGERATQLTLKSFHSGGLATRGPSMVNSFTRVQQLTSLPKDIPNAARLAERDGVIEKIEEDPTGHIAYIGGVPHHIPNDAFGNPLFKPPPGETETIGPGSVKWTGVQVGMRVKAGQTLTDPSRTNVNPHDLYRVTGNMSEVQNQMVTELHDIYGREGVRRQNTEMAVRALSDLTRVMDPGDHENLVKGQFTSRAKVQSANKELVKQGLQPIEHVPVLKGIEVMPLEVQEDWMAKLNHQRLRTSLMESAALGAASNLHGNNPVPSMAYGAEVGLTSADAYMHPHLKDVPKHSY